MTSPARNSDGNAIYEFGVLCQRAPHDSTADLFNFHYLLMAACAVKLEVQGDATG